jgi:translocator protein
MKYLFLIGSILLALSAGWIGAFFTVSSVDSWYTTLVQPSFAPPAWVFGPVWTLLYILMGISAFIIWQHRSHALSRIALMVYGVQLVLNTCWSIIFFGMQNPGWAFAEILVLLIMIIITTGLFWRVSRVAGALLIPYLAWVSFASYLNYAIWILN